MSDTYGIHTYDAKPRFTPEPDITEIMPLSKLTDEQADDMAQFIRNGLAFLDELGKQAEKDSEVPGFTPSVVTYEPAEFKPRAKRNAKGQFVKDEHLSAAEDEC